MKYFGLVRYFSGLLFLLFSGCSSTTETESQLPWARPANWELHHDITPTTTINKEYRPEVFNRR